VKRRILGADTNIVVEIARKIAGQVGFVALPRRWVVERFFAWISRNRRLAKDFEATMHSARAFLRRLDHTARSPYRQGNLNFEPDS
jgi:transposase